jgi:hypothetical protein
MDWRDIYHVTCFPCGLRYATIEMCFLCVVRAERIWEDTGMGTYFTWVPKFQGKSSVARSRIRRFSVWRYMCHSHSNFESVRTDCSYDQWRSNKPIHQSKSRLSQSITWQYVTYLQRHYFWYDLWNITRFDLRCTVYTFGSYFQYPG